MSLATLANRLITAIVPSIDAHAGCGRCVGKWTTTCCSDPRLVKHVYVDSCDNKCGPTACLKNPLCVG